MLACLNPRNGCELSSQTTQILSFVVVAELVVCKRGCSQAPRSVEVDGSPVARIAFDSLCHLRVQTRFDTADYCYRVQKPGSSARYQRKTVAMYQKIAISTLKC